MSAFFQDLLAGYTCTPFSSLVVGRGIRSHSAKEVCYQTRASLSAFPFFAYCAIAWFAAMIDQLPVWQYGRLSAAQAALIALLGTRKLHDARASSTFASESIIRRRVALGARRVCDHSMGSSRYVCRTAYDVRR